MKRTCNRLVKVMLLLLLRSFLFLKITCSGNYGDRGEILWSPHNLYCCFFTWRCFLPISVLFNLSIYWLLMASGVLHLFKFFWFKHRFLCRHRRGCLVFVNTLSSGRVATILVSSCSPCSACSHPSNVGLISRLIVVSVSFYRLKKSLTMIKAHHRKQIQTVLVSFCRGCFHDYLKDLDTVHRYLCSLHYLFAVIACKEKALFLLKFAGLQRIADKTAEVLPCYNVLLQ